MKTRSKDLEIVEDLLDLLTKTEQTFEVPVAASIYDQEMNLISESLNQRESANDPTAHAEICVLRQAGTSQGNWNLEGFSLYITLEPCLMCAGAIYWSQLGRLVFGASEEKRGFLSLGKDVLHPKTNVTSGILAEESALLLKEFFSMRR